MFSHSPNFQALHLSYLLILLLFLVLFHFTYYICNEITSLISRLLYSRLLNKHLSRSRANRRLVFFTAFVNDANGFVRNSERFSKDLNSLSVVFHILFFAIIFTSDFDLRLSAEVTPFVSILRSVQMRKQQQHLLRASGAAAGVACGMGPW